MYANLRVTPLEGATVRADVVGAGTLRRQRRGAGMGDSMYAYAVKIEPDGTARVKLDNNDGGSYSEHAGHVVIRGGCTISAEF